MVLQGSIGVDDLLALCGLVITSSAGSRCGTCRGRGLAMTGSVLSMIPCTELVLPVGLPVGIWALVVLNNADVKAGFAAVPRAAAAGAGSTTSGGSRWPLVRCPECDAELEVADEDLGEPMACGACGAAFTARAARRRPATMTPTRTTTTTGRGVAGGWQVTAADVEDARRAVAAPAQGLILTGWISAVAVPARRDRVRGLRVRQPGVGRRGHPRRRPRVAGGRRRRWWWSASRTAC